MDLLAEIFKSLNDKEYDDITRIRLIYFCVCEVFSYDIRYCFASENMKEKIYNTVIDPKNVEEFEVVCYTIARVLIDVLAEFGYKGEIVRKTDGYLTHVYVTVKINGYTLILDPTNRHDITRVKMGIPTIDFEVFSDSLEKDTVAKILTETDAIIASNSKFDLSQNTVKDTANKLFQNIDEDAQKNNSPKEETFFKKLDVLYQMINSRTDFKRYDDIDFYYLYLLKILEKNMNETSQDNNDYYIRPIPLFNSSDDSRKDIINLSCIKYGNLPPMLYLLKKEGDTYNIREIFKDEAIEILKNYETPFFIGQSLLNETIANLPKDKKNGIII